MSENELSAICMARIAEIGWAAWLEEASVDEVALATELGLTDAEPYDPEIERIEELCRQYRALERPSDEGEETK